jgi:hypothetical protein
MLIDAASVVVSSLAPVPNMPLLGLTYRVCRVGEQHVCMCVCACVGGGREGEFEG